MSLIVEAGTLEDYLLETAEVDYSHRMITAATNELFGRSRNEIDFIQLVYEFVRDRIAHSWDIQSTRITCNASDVLTFKEGICYAKSNLLAALLRRQGIPTGFCYQRLTLGDTPDTGYVIHALNAVYVQSAEKWIRLDARGNKAGVNAQFSLEEEQLAFPVREQCDEIDYPVIYTRPHPLTIEALLQNSDCKEMYRRGLPSAL